MANHAGGDALRDVIELLAREGVWALLGPERTRELILQFVRIGHQYDCPSGDILDGMYERYRICAYCRSAADSYRDDLCPACYARWNAPEPAPAKPS